MIAKIIIILISMVTVDNFPLSQFLGICPFLGVSTDLDSAKGMGIAVTFVMTLATIVTWPVQQLLDKLGIGYLQTVVFILIIAALVQFIEMFMKKNMPALYKGMGIYLPLITTNCAVLGVCIDNINNGYNFAESIAQAFGGQSRIPKSFQGVPIVLTTASILSLAFLGFQGLFG